MGANAEDRTYPMDDVPACMQRSDNAEANHCILKGTGKSNQMIRPYVDFANETAAGSPAIVPAESRESAIAFKIAPASSQ
jgi:hypothetical protein